MIINRGHVPCSYIFPAYISFYYLFAGGDIHKDMGLNFDTAIHLQI